MSSIVFKNICKAYENEYGLIDFDCEFKSGEFVTVIGSSGAGKSTLLKIIAGLLTPDCGELYIADELVNDKKASDRDIAMMFQEYVLYPNYNVYENVRAYLKFNREPHEIMHKKVFAALSLFGIEKLANRRIKELSGGQQQRVALAKIFVRSPRIILFDEPLSNIDEANKKEYRNNILKLKELLPDTTFVYVTHNIGEALSLGDRVLLLEEGRKVAILPPGDLITYPPTMAYLEAINNMNKEVVETDLSLLEAFYLDSIKNKEEVKYIVKNNKKFIAYDDNEELISGAKDKISFDGNLANGVITFDNFEIKLPSSLTARLLSNKGRVKVNFLLDKFHTESLPGDVKFEVKLLNTQGVHQQIKINEEIFIVNRDYALGDKTLYYNLDDIEIYADNGDKVLANYTIYQNRIPVERKGSLLVINKDKIAHRQLVNGLLLIPLDGVKGITHKRGLNKIRVNILSEEIINNDKKLVYAYIPNTKHYISFYQPKRLVINYKIKNYIVI